MKFGISMGAFPYCKRHWLCKESTSGPTVAPVVMSFREGSCFGSRYVVPLLCYLQSICMQFEAAVSMIKKSCGILETRVGVVLFDVVFCARRHTARASFT